jgi:4-oxalocrotonate tautomerase family enzyme
MEQAVGFIETIGMAAAIEAADAALKSANVKMVGYELTNGFGMVTVKVQGDIGAVKSAIYAAGTASAKVNRVYSVNVIPRPAKPTAIIIRTGETVSREDVAAVAGGEVPAVSSQIEKEVRKMPVITVEGAPLRFEQKKLLIESLTKIASVIMDVSEKNYIVLIKENDKDNIGLGGSVLSQRIDKTLPPARQTV